MISHKRQQNKAFTLVEMAIVITIIGLLAGGAVVAQGLIKTSQLSAMMSNSKYYINAFGQFQTMYKAIPGDMYSATSNWSGTSNGNGNGVIRAGNNNANEMYYAFQHLALAGFIDGSYSGTSTGTLNTNVPASPYKGAALIFDHPDALDGAVSGDSYYFDGLYGHVLRIAGLLPYATGMPQNAFLTAKQALEIDRKFDDGMPGTGWVMTPNATGLPGCATSATVYNVSNDATSCYLLLRVQ